MSSYIRGAPGGLKIKTSRNAVYIEDLACKVQTFADFAFHRFEINFF
jgi:hypothetical protein